MKKIAFVVNNLAKGGMERVVVTLASQLVLLGYSVSVIVTEGRINDEYSDCNAEIVDLTQEHKLKSLLSKSFYLKDILEPFDAVFLHYYFTYDSSDFLEISIFQCVLYYANKTFLVNHNNEFSIDIAIKEIEKNIDKKFNALEGDYQNYIKAKDYVSLYINFTNIEFISFITNILSHDNMLFCLNEIFIINESLDNFLLMINTFVIEYCNLFNKVDCQGAILTTVSVNMSSAILLSDLNDYYKSSLCLKLSQKQLNDYTLLYTLLCIKNDETKKIVKNKWYKFGKLKNKLKIITMIKLLLSYVLNRFGK